MNNTYDFSFKAPDKKAVSKIVKVVVIVLAVLIILFNGIYILNSGEEAVITRFGAYANTVTNPGLQIKVPFIDVANVVNVESIRRMEFGFRSDAYEETALVNAEAIMLTGDENLVIADWSILYRVKNSYDFLYKVDDVEGTLRIIAESSYRRVVAAHPLDDILTNQKDIIQNEIMADLQQICDKYEIGVVITAVQLQDAMPPDPVKEAFLDVSSAKEEKAAKINEASKYANEKIPVARGDAAKMLNEAEGYKQRRINEAEGAVARYKAIELEYQKQPEIMRTRLYLEMINEVLPKVQNVYIVNSDGDMVKFLPIGNGAVIPGGTR